ncbi:hypothetical protein K438DRAFT_1777521 [Mycena galopus ATCC 62051]|nr:hypothetical protein K438DRAFT_1777521 [Mycena galopus ATCC 62051]
MPSTPFLPLASLTLSLTLEIKTAHGARPCVPTSLDGARRRCWPTLGGPPPRTRVQPLEQEFKFFIAMNPVGGRMSVSPENYIQGIYLSSLSLASPDCSSPFMEICGCVLLPASRQDLREAFMRSSYSSMLEAAHDWDYRGKVGETPSPPGIQYLSNFLGTTLPMDSSAATAAVYSVLCSEKAWHWDTDDGHNLIFYRDGTGEITSWAELNAWIFAIFEWKVNDPATVKYTPTALPPPPSLVQRLVSPSQPPMVPVLRASIEFTLTKRRTPFGVRLPHRLNEELLLDAAFAPRVLNITVERGRFPASWDYVPVQPDIPKSWFQSQLTFDVSPYPVRETWDPKLYDMVDSIGQPNMTKFCAHKLAPGPDRGAFC